MIEQGDLIQWSFDDNHPDKMYAGKTFTGHVAIITDNSYGVYCDYGQDLIPFEQAIKTTKNENRNKKITRHL